MGSEPHSNMNCAQLERDVDIDDPTDSLTGFASCLFVSTPVKLNCSLFCSKRIHATCFNCSHPSIICGRGM